MSCNNNCMTFNFLIYIYIYINIDIQYIVHSIQEGKKKRFICITYFMLTVVISWLFSEAGYVLLNNKYDMIISQKDKGEPFGSVLFVQYISTI